MSSNQGYQVQAGDTGLTIAAKLGVSFPALEAANPGVDWNLLQIGQTLQVPGSGSQQTTYTIVAGDTGEAIAARFNITFAQLEAANPSANWNDLQIGEILQIPSSSSQQTTYAVVAGDTGDAIAARFNITLAQLEAANPGVDWNNLQIGEILNIPSASAPSLPPTGPNDPDAGTNGDPTVRQYSGPASSFPDPSQWQKFSLMWQADAPIMANFDTSDQISFIKQAIATVSAESGIDPRVILCVIMQETHGNVHATTTKSPGAHPVTNPGLMQSHAGVDFDENNQQGSILQMIRDGTEGTASGDGIKQCFEHQGNFYAAFREYNSGAGGVNLSNLSDGGGATGPYVSDMANRLMGAQPN